MTYKKRILKVAEAELREMYAWLDERSPDGAARWLVAFETAVETLLENPAAAPLAPENEFVDDEVRMFLFRAVCSTVCPR